MLIFSLFFLFFVSFSFSTWKSEESSERTGLNWSVDRSKWLAKMKRIQFFLQKMKVGRKSETISYTARESADFSTNNNKSSNGGGWMKCWWWWRWWDGRRVKMAVEKDGRYLFKMSGGGSVEDLTAVKKFYLWNEKLLYFTSSSTKKKENSDDETSKNILKTKKV